MRVLPHGLRHRIGRTLHLGLFRVAPAGYVPHCATSKKVNKPLTSPSLRATIAGHGERKNVVEPRRVTALEGKRVVEVSCGAYHTAVRTDAGRVYTFGAGSQGALGI